MIVYTMLTQHCRIIKWNTESKENVWGTTLSEGAGKQKCIHDLDYGGKKRKYWNCTQGEKKTIGKVVTGWCD